MIEIMKKSFFAVLIVLIFIVFSSCSPSETPAHSAYYEMNKAGADTYLPKGAVVTKELGNGWVTFTLDDHEYLFFLIKSGYKAYSAVTLIK